MAIYYSPYPTTQPPTALTQYVVGDWWVNLTLKYAYKLTISGAGFKSWVRTTTAPLPNINNIPAIVASTVTSSSSATIGQAISFNAITASGGATLATSYTTAGTVTGYNVTVSPALPAGLSVTKTLSVITGTDSNGNATLLNNIIVGISGTPTGPATLATSYTVTVTDASGLTASASFSLSVQSSGVAALTTTLAIPSSTITQGNTVNIVPVTAVGGTTPLTFSISPTLSGTGLSLNSSNGAITGTANTISSKTYVITVTDSSAVPQSNSRNYSLTINGIPLSSFLDTPTTVLTNKIAFTSFRPVRGSGGFGTLSYTINPALPAGLSFSSSNGFISGTATEASPQTEYSVTVRDSSNPQQTTTPLSFNLTVNELQPVTAIVAQSNLSLTINTPVATAPVQGGATIPIQGGGGFGTLTYSISPALGVSGLTFDTTTGLISGTPTATKTLTTYTVTVTDQATTPQTANAQFTLSVAAATLTTSVDISPVSLFKGVPTSLTSSIGYKPVSAKDGFGTYSYALTGNTLPTGLSFSNSTGIITGTANTLMVSPGNTFTVTVTDQTTPVNQTSSKDFVLIVSQPQALVLTNNESETRSLTRGVTTSFTSATASGGYGTYTYSISPTLPSALVFNTNNGTISGTPANSNTSITSYTVTVTDQASQTQNTSFDLVINTPIYFKLSTTPTQNVTKGVSIISFAPVLASGGDPSYTYSVTSGTLPAGLSLNSSTGYLSGTPTTVAANTFTITVTDQASQNLTQNCTVTVAEPAALTTTLNQTNTRSLVVNTTQTAFTPVGASGGYGTISFAITPALPSGLTFLSSNGYIFGTASALKGNSSYRVTASDIVSPPQTSFKDFFLEVTNAPLLASTTIANRSIVKNTIITSFTPVTASGGTPPYSYSASLPSGLTINSSTGAISGNASITQSSTSTTVNVSDVAGASTSNTFNLTTTEPDALSVNVSTANATFGVAYSRRIVTPSGGFGNYTYSLTSGTLTGTGLILNANTGFIAGTPTALKANNSYTIQVSDTSGQTANGTFNFSILPVALTSTVSSTSVSVQLYRAVTPFIPVRGNGGFGTLSYQITSGTLPDGLTFNTSTGQISGTPTATASASLTVTITDEALTPQTAVGTFTLNVASAAPPALQAVLAQSSYSFNVGEVVNFTPVTGSGGYPGGTYQYVLTGTLPSGLSFNTTTGNISGTFTEAFTSLSFTVTVNDEVPQYASKSFTLEGISPLVTAVDLTARNKSQLAYDHSNAAFLQANSAYASQNVTGTYANSAYTQANTAINNSAGASIYANAAFLAANTPSHVANSAALYANAAFIHANAAFNAANTGGGSTTDQYARDTANAAGSYANSAYSQANTATNDAAGASLYANAAFSKANSVLSGFAANTLIVANGTGYLSNSNAEFSLSNNTLYVPNANISNEVIANSLVFYDGTRLNSATGISANTAATANVTVYARMTNVTTGTYFPIVTDTTITGSDTLHYSSNDFVMYAANNTFRATGNLWAGQFLTVGSNVPVVNSTGHWVGQTISAGSAASANVSNIAINARITNVTTGTYFPIVTDTTVTGSDTLHYSSNDFLMYASNNTFRATGNLWAGTSLTVGTNIPVVNSTGHWVGQTISAGSAGSANTANVAINARITIVNTGIYYPIVTDTTITGTDTLHYSSNDFLMYASNNTFKVSGNVWAGEFIAVGNNIPVVNSTGHWIGQTVNGVDSFSRSTANSAALYANGAFIAANTADSKAVTSGSYANAAFAHANAAFNAANTGGGGGTGNASFIFSGTSNVYFTSANGSIVANVGGNTIASVTNTGILMSGAEGDISGANNVYANTFIANTRIRVAGTGGDISGANNITANTFTVNNTIVVAGSGGDISGANNITANVLNIANGIVAAGVNVVTHLQSSFLAANTPSHVANSAALYANGAFTKANTDVTDINIISGTFGNSTHIPVVTVSANGRINVISTVAATGGGGGSGNASFIFSGTSNVYFTTANGSIVANVGGNTIASVTNTGILMSGAEGDISGANNVYANTFIANTRIRVAGTGGDISGANNITANVLNIANGIVVAGVNVVTHLQSAFLAANTPSHVANSAALYANAAFTKANTDVTDINITSGTFGNSTHIPVVTISANGRINAISTVAATGGGSGSGNASFIFSGTSNVYFATANGNIVANVGGNTIASVTNTGIQMSGDEGDISGANNVYANTFVANSTIVISGSGGDISGASNITGNNIIAANGVTVAGLNVVPHLLSAFTAANTPSHVANSAALYANGSFIAANTADSKAVTAGSYANSAFSVANTDVTNINITGGVYGNSSSIPVITLAANGRIIAVSNATVSGGGGSGEDQFARDTANAAFIQANAAFNAANTGGGGGSGVDQYARDTANAAFNAANTTTSNNGTTLSGTITPLANTSDQFNIIGITGDITIAAPAGTPTEGQKLIIRLKDAGTGVNISWNVIYKAIGFTLPTSTVANKTAYIGFIYNTADADWDGVAISLES
jgi:hypothetical protein